MGDDLYMEDMPREKQYRGFEVSGEAVDVGYFRDCCDSHGLFANLGLSWWKLIDEPDVFEISRNGGVLKHDFIPDFRDLLSIKFDEVEGEWKAKGEEFYNKYREWYELLIRFLDLAEKKKSNIIFSV